MNSDNYLKHLTVDIPDGVPIPDIISEFAQGDYPTGFDKLFWSVCGCGHQSRPFVTGELLHSYMMTVHNCGESYHWYWATREDA